MYVEDAKKSYSCKLCGDVANLLFKTLHEGKEYTVVRCVSCDVLQTVERYSFVSPDYVGLTNDEIDADRLWCQCDHKLPAFTQWARQTETLLAGRPTRRVLDVGCGTGGFMQFARSRGYEVYGYDASEAQAAKARESFSTVRQAISPSRYLEALDHPDLRFDVVTLWDVFEHLTDPLAFLEELREVLAEGGLLYLSVPNGRAMSLKRFINPLLGRSQFEGWIPWEHVFYYTLDSLRRYLATSSYMPLDGGAVVCYPRSMSLFEGIRRLGFLVSGAFPSVAPQIYMWAKRPSYQG